MPRPESCPHLVAPPKMNEAWRALRTGDFMKKTQVAYREGIMAIDHAVEWKSCSCQGTDSDIDQINSMYLQKDCACSFMGGWFFPLILHGIWLHEWNWPQTENSCINLEVRALECLCNNSLFRNNLLCVRKKLLWLRLGMTFWSVYEIQLR